MEIIAIIVSSCGEEEQGNDVLLILLAEGELPGFLSDALVFLGNTELLCFPLGDCIGGTLFAPDCSLLFLFCIQLSSYCISCRLGFGICLIKDGLLLGGGAEGLESICYMRVWFLQDGLNILLFNIDRFRHLDAGILMLGLRSLPQGLALGGGRLLQLTQLLLAERLGKGELAPGLNGISRSALFGIAATSSRCGDSAPSITPR